MLCHMNINFSFSVEDFIYHLRLFLDTVQLDQIVYSECQIIIKEIGLAVTVYNKFFDIWTKVGIKDK